MWRVFPITADEPDDGADRVVDRCCSWSRDEDDAAKWREDNAGLEPCAKVGLVRGDDTIGGGCLRSGDRGRERGIETDRDLRMIDMGTGLRYLDMVGGRRRTLLPWCPERLAYLDLGGPPLWCGYISHE